jgi:hypothetical protein
VHRTQYIGLLIVDVSEFKLPGEVEQNNQPPECGQLIDTGDILCSASARISKGQGYQGFLNGKNNAIKID